MSKDRSTMRGRGEEILGRGVDALFGGSPADAEIESAASSPAEIDDELNILLAAESQEATEPSPISHAEPSLIAPANATIAGSGVVISDEELFANIDVPLNVEETTIDQGLETEGDMALPPQVQPAPIPPAFDSSPIEASPAPADFVPSPVETPQPQSIQPQPDISVPTIPSSPSSPTIAPPISHDLDAAALPSRPRPQFTGVLSEVRVTEADRIGPEAIRPPSPFDQRPAVVIEEPVAPNRTQQERQALLTHIQQQRIDELNAQIDKLYRDIPMNISNRPDLSSQAMGLLRQSRTILLERPEDFVEAEYRVQQAQSLYNRIENSEMWGDQYGWRIFIYEIILLAFLLFSFVGLLAFGDEFSKWLAGKVGAAEPSDGLITAVGFWSTIAWGGIGGVMGALFTLWTHISERQDFERQHTMWYIVQPILGIILGGVIFLILYTGLLSLQGGEVAAQSLATTPQLLPALLAFIAGFRPQFLFDLLTKIIKVINPADTTPG